MARIDLTQEQLELIRSVLTRHGVGPEHRPVLFGSRAGGVARRYSDLDLAFVGRALDGPQLRDVRADLEESPLPFFVDVLNLEEAGSELRASLLDSAVPLDEAIAA